MHIRRQQVLWTGLRHGVYAMRTAVACVCSGVANAWKESNCKFIINYEAYYFVFGYSFVGSLVL